MSVDTWVGIVAVLAVVGILAGLTTGVLPVPTWLYAVSTSDNDPRLP